MTTLAQLQETCLALLFSTQSHTVGFPSLEVVDNFSLASHLSEKELQLLALYDKLRHVSLQKQMLEEGVRPGEIDEKVPTAKIDKNLVEAVASVQLKDSVIDATIITPSILKAIHDADASAKVRGLLPLIERRDTLSLTHANISHALTNAYKSLSDAEHKYCKLQERNRGLAERLVEQSKERQEQYKKDQGPEYASAEKELIEVKKKWNMMKEVVQAVIVSSGVDWSRDEKLKRLVLECGQE